MLAELKQLEVGGREVRRNAQDADHRDPRLLQRSLDARDADALSRAASGPGIDRPRIRGQDQRLCRHRRVSSRRIPARRGSSRWSASSPACRSSTRWSSGAKQIEVPKYLRPRTDTPKLTVGHGGCFGCIYSVRGAGGYQMFGITPMPIYDPKQEISLSPRLHDLLQSRRHREIQAGRPRRLMTRRSTRWTRRPLRAAHPAGDLRSRRVPRRPRRLQRQDSGGAPWQLRFVKPGLSTTVQDLGRPGYYHLGIPALRRHGSLRLRAANLLVGNTENAAVLEAVFHGAGARVRARLHRRGDRRRNDAEGRWRGAADAGPPSRSRQARRCPSTFSKPAPAPMSPFPAASTCRSSSAAARPIRSARSAAMRAGR